MSRKKVVTEGVQLMSVELSHTQSYLPGLHKELDITPQILYR